MTLAPDTPCTAFADHRLIASGPLAEVAIEVKALVDSGTVETILVFEDATGQQVQLDWRGPAADVLAQLAAPAPAVAEAPRVGRPKLGVTAREVTLLPRHWDWLAEQPGGASAALRRLVEDARRTHAALLREGGNLNRLTHAGKDAARKAQAAAHRVMSALAGDLPGYEEALRAFYAGDADGFAARIAAWPMGVRDYVGLLAARALTEKA